MKSYYSYRTTPTDFAWFEASPLKAEVTLTRRDHPTHGVRLERTIVRVPECGGEDDAAFKRLYKRQSRVFGEEPWREEGGAWRVNSREQFHLAGEAIKSYSLMLGIGKARGRLWLREPNCDFWVYRRQFGAAYRPPRPADQEARFLLQLFLDGTPADRVEVAAALYGRARAVAGDLSVTGRVVVDEVVLEPGNSYWYRAVRDRLVVIQS